jgi:hypothetical protein
MPANRVRAVTERQADPDGRPPRPSSEMPGREDAGGAQGGPLLARDEYRRTPVQVPRLERLLLCFDTAPGVEGASSLAEVGGELL